MEEFFFVLAEYVYLFELNNIFFTMDLKISQEHNMLQT